MCGQRVASWCDDDPCRNGADCRDDFNGVYGCECPLGKFDVKAGLKKKFRINEDTFGAIIRFHGCIYLN